MAKVIDSDGHVVEPRAVWTEYIEPEFRDGVIQIRRSHDGVDQLWINGENRSRASLPVAASMIPGGLRDLEHARTLTWDDVPPGGWNPRERLKVMDAEGIDVAVLYPSLWLLYGDLVEPKLAAAACRAYNNWMADFCKESPTRLYAVAPMPLQDVEEAVREMRRVVRELGFKAVFVRPNPFAGRRLKIGRAHV
jgi:predicted TIM-barrel fold metal-dependent hydrolase